MEPQGRNVLLTGLHRSGTTLLSSLLSRQVNVVALNEPIAVSQLVGLPDTLIFERIDRFLAIARRSLIATGCAVSRHVTGSSTDNYFADQPGAAGRRQTAEQLGLVDFGNRPDLDFTLCLKHNAAFTALLPLLASRYPCYALIRNPLSLLLSWQSVEMAVGHGRLPIAERLDPDLRRRLVAEPDELQRQLIILDWFFSQYARHLPEPRVLRYERLVGDTLGELQRIVPEAALAPKALRSRNANRAYPLQELDRLASSLLASDCACWHYYSRNDVAELMHSLRA